jgi:hypothetical protein
MDNNVFTVDQRAIVFERYDDEVIAINLNTGMYYSLNQSAADTFELLADGCPVTELIAALQPRYNDDLRLFEREFLGIVSELRRALLIEPAKSNGKLPPNPSPTSHPKLVFEPPVLKVHDDLQELFLLDPVHEVGAEGWPTPQPPQQ